MEGMQLFDGLVNNVYKLADGYSKVTLAKQGVVTPVTPVETNGASSPVVMQGAPANVKAGEDFLTKLSDNATQAYTANRLHKSAPYILGAVVAVIALGALIYGLRK